METHNPESITAAAEEVSRRSFLQKAGLGVAGFCRLLHSPRGMRHGW